MKRQRKRKSVKEALNKTSPVLLVQELVEYEKIREKNIKDKERYEAMRSLRTQRLLWLNSINE